MTNYNQTRLGRSYTHYLKEYLQAFVERKFEMHTIGESVIFALNRQRGNLPKTNLPYVVPPNHAANTRNQTIVISDMAGIKDEEASLRYINTVLTSVWEDPLVKERFLPMRKFAAKAYMNWVSRGLVNRFSLPFEDKTHLDILCAIFFYCNGHDFQEVIKSSNYKFYADIGELTGLGANRLVHTMEKCGLKEIEGRFDMDALVDAMRLVSRDCHEKISYSSLTSVLARSWYGEAGMFYCNLALEYPPMFLTLVYFALTDRTYSRSQFGNVLKEFSIGRRVDQGDTFTRNLGQAIKDFNIKSLDI